MSDTLLAYIYVSRRAQPEIDLQALHSLSIEKNYEHHITGFLSVKGNKFLQYIEGHPEKINQLVVNLKNDKSHEITREFYFNTPRTRIFPTWSMRLIDPDPFNSIVIEDIIANLLDIVANGGKSPLYKEQLLRNLEKIKEISTEKKTSE